MIGKVPARLNILTLGVRDLPKVRAFYEALGWESRSEGDEFARFQTGGATLALFSLDLLAGEANMQPSESTGRFLGFTCAVLVEEEAMIDEAIEKVREAGGRMLAEPVARECGGRADSGRPWTTRAVEVPHAADPGWQLARAGKHTGHPPYRIRRRGHRRRRRGPASSRR